MVGIEDLSRAVDDIAVELANERLRLSLPNGWRVRVQSAITTGDSDPEPDMVVVRGVLGSAPRHHPLPTEIGLLIAVADTTLQNDQLRKSEIDARAEILRYGVINQQDLQGEYLSDPSSPIANAAYSIVRINRPGQQWSLELDGRSIATIDPAELLSWGEFNAVVSIRTNLSETGSVRKKSHRETVRVSLKRRTD